VLWGWATLPLHDEEREALTRLTERLGSGSELGATLRLLLSDAEVAALRTRCDDLLAHGRMPLPSGEWPAIPWPAF
jgi:hypothetical protein